LSGADATMIASSLYRNGIGHVGALVDGVRQWLEANDFHSVEQLKGMLSHKRCPDPSAFERANYAKALSSFAAGTS
jgi:dihydroorotate dehydrogenase (fumarate)